MTFVTVPAAFTIYIPHGRLISFAPALPSVEATAVPEVVYTLIPAALSRVTVMCPSAPLNAHLAAVLSSVYAVG